MLHLPLSTPAGGVYQQSTHALPVDIDRVLLVPSLPRTIDNRRNARGHHLNHRANPVCQRVRSCAGSQKSRVSVSYDFRYAAAWKCHHRDPRRKGFEYHPWRGVERTRRHDKQIQACEDALNVIAPAEKLNRQSAAFPYDLVEIAAV